MNKPYILAVDDNGNTRELIERELRRRYSADYEILCCHGPEKSLESLRELRDAGAEVALILASSWMMEMDGAELLHEAQRIYPDAKRALLMNMADPQAAEVVMQATTMGTIDSFGAKPWREGDENFHRFVTDFLADWAADHRPQFEMVRVVGERWDRRSHEFRDLLERNGITYGFYEAGSEMGRRLLQYAECENAPLPVIILAQGDVLVNPTNSEVAEALDVTTAFDVTGFPEGELVDVVIVGAGPAGLSAAVYGASEGLQTVVLEREALGGQAGKSSRIRNYLGFPNGLSGRDLATRAYRQAWLFGADFTFTQEVVNLERRGDYLRVTLSNGNRITTRAVILAMGAKYRELEIPALDKLIGAGVYYGSVSSEAMALRGQDVFVVGGGNSAGQAVTHLSKFAGSVTLLVRGEDLTSSMSDYLIKEVDYCDNTQLRFFTEIVGGGGEHRLEYLVLRDVRTRIEETVPAAGLFVLIGAEPHTDWLPPEILRDAGGYIITGPSLLEEGHRPDSWPLDRQPFLLETSLPGVFAVGDVRSGSVKRVASAVGEGSMAIQFLHQLLAARN